MNEATRRATHPSALQATHGVQEGAIMQSVITLSVLVLGCALLLTACDTCDTEREVMGTVESVRTVTYTSSDVRGESGVAGAIVGGLIAGGVGAVVGAMATREDEGLIVRQDTYARVIVNQDGVKYEFYDLNRTRRRHPGLLLLRVGDRVRMVVQEGGFASHPFTQLLPFGIYGNRAPPQIASTGTVSQ